MPIITDLEGNILNTGDSVKYINPYSPQHNTIYKIRKARLYLVIDMLGNQRNIAYMSKFLLKVNQ